MRWRNAKEYEEAHEMVTVEIDLFDDGKYPGDWLHWRLHQEAEKRGMRMKDFAVEVLKRAVSS